MTGSYPQEGCAASIEETTQLGAVDEVYGGAVGRYRWTCEAGHTGTEDITERA